MSQNKINMFSLSRLKKSRRMSHDEILNDFLLFDDDLSVTSDPSVPHDVGATAPMIQSLELEKVPHPALHRSTSDPMTYTQGDNRPDDLSLHPSDVDSEALEQPPALMDEDDMAPASPRHTTNSFINVGVLMVQHEAPPCDVIVSFNNEDSLIEHKDSVTVSTLISIAIVQGVRLGLVLIVMTAQLFLQSLAWIRHITKAWINLIVWMTAFVTTFPRQMHILVVAATLFVLSGYTKLTHWVPDLPLESHYDVDPEQHITTPDPVISVMFETEVGIHGWHLDFLTAVIKSFTNFQLFNTQEERMESDFKAHRENTIESTEEHIDLYYMGPFVSLFLVLVVFIRVFEKVQKMPHQVEIDASRMTNDNIDFSTPVKYSSLSELGSQRLLLGFNESGKLKDQIRELIMTRKNLFSELKRDDLRIILKDHGMSPTGLKKDLAQRLAEQWRIVPLPISKKEMAKSLIQTRRQLFGECKSKDLQSLLKEHGMSPSGNKAQLCQRLAESHGTIRILKSR